MNVYEITAKYSYTNYAEHFGKFITISPGEDRYSFLERMDYLYDGAATFYEHWDKVVTYYESIREYDGYMLYKPAIFVANDTAELRLLVNKTLLHWHDCLEIKNLQIITAKICSPGPTFPPTKIQVTEDTIADVCTYLRNAH